MAQKLADPSRPADKLCPADRLCPEDKRYPFVFVTVGSTDFDPLVQAVDALAPSIRATGVMQIGHGQYIPTNWPHFRFAPSLDSYYEQAGLVVAHGGLATTMEVLRRSLPLVSVSNPDRYDNHQDDLLSAMAQEGYLIWCQDLDQLGKAVEDALKAAQSSSLKPYEPGECRIHTVIHDYLRDEILGPQRNNRRSVGQRPARRT